MEILVIGPGDADRVVAAGKLFDDRPKLGAVERFLAEPNHHLLVAYEHGSPAGFVTGVETTHPDKGTEMFLYELRVDEAFRGRGIGRSLVQRLGEVARSRGCYGMWAGTEPDNAAAIATYRSAGAAGMEESVVLTWEFGTGKRTPG